MGRRQKEGGRREKMEREKGEEKGRKTPPVSFTGKWVFNASRNNWNPLTTGKGHLRL